MRYGRVGGRAVSAISLGCARLSLPPYAPGPATARRTIDAAVDAAVPLADSLGALADLQHAGKIARFGVSNVAVADVAACAAAGAVSVQNRLSLDAPDGADAAAAGGRGLGFLAWAPLAGVRTDDETEARPEVCRIAADAGVTVRQLALAWLMSLPGAPVPLVGARDPAEVAESVAALDVPAGAVAEIAALLAGEHDDPRGCPRP